MNTYPITEEVSERINNNFSYHQQNEDQAVKYEQIRRQGMVFAHNMATLCPPSRELSLALTALEEAVMWANAAIARNE